MRRRIVIVLLALGTIGGYAAGFAHMRHHGCHAQQQHSVDRGCDERSDSR